MVEASSKRRSKAGYRPALEYTYIQKEVISMPKQPSCGERVQPQGEKRYEIQGGSQEMAVMVGYWQKFQLCQFR